MVANHNNSYSDSNIISDGNIIPNVIIVSDVNVESEVPKKAVIADFEAAIAAAEYGKFHIMLLLSAMPAYWSIVFVTSTVSFTLTGAECDLDINFMQKGVLTSIPSVGMLISSLFWGYLSDKFGRKNIMAYGLIVVAVIELIGSMSQTYWMLLITKFIAGFMITGPFAVLLTYISELHSTSVRARVVISSGIFFSMANIGLPLVAWAVIPQDLDFSFFNGFFVIHSWNIFLAVCSLPALFSGLAILAVPESPKFLMSRGRNFEALEIFKKIYSKNTGYPPEDYPVKELIDETKDKAGEQKTKGDAVALGSHLPWLLLCCFINVSSRFGGNAMRLWFPQIAGILDDYTSRHDNPAGICEILDTYSNTNDTLELDEEEYLQVCVKLTTGSATYVSNVIVGLSSVVSYLIAGYLVNVLGKKKLLLLYYLIGLACPIALPWTSSVTETVILFSVFLASSGTSMSTLMSVVVDLFPTSVRAIAVTIVMMFARLGTISGSIAFPALLQSGCTVPFYTIAALTLLAGVGCMILPGTNQKKME